MKYILLIYQPANFDPKALDPDQYKAVADGYAALNSTPHVKGGPPLGLPENAITVRVSDGEATATPGPYLQQPGAAVGGFIEFEAETDEEAVRLAARIPAARLGGAIEIRPSKIYW